ncbi:MAG: DUF6308 family protein [Gordonia amarae]
MATDGMRLPDILGDDHTDLAVATLRKYFHADPKPAFSGSRFERFAGGGDRAETANEFTADDLVAVGLLNVNIPGTAALRILGDHEPAYRDELSKLLRQLPTDLALADADDQTLAIADELWTLVRVDNYRVGLTKTSKLLARKRPHLLPVIDSVVIAEVGHKPGTHNFYRNLRAALNDNDRHLTNHLAEVRRVAGIGDDISTIRVFDILVWMWGTKRTAAG